MITCEFCGEPLFETDTFFQLEESDIVVCSGCMKKTSLEQVEIPDCYCCGGPATYTDEFHTIRGEPICEDCLSGLKEHVPEEVITDPDFHVSPHSPYDNQIRLDV